MAHPSKTGEDRRFSRRAFLTSAAAVPAAAAWTTAAPRVARQPAPPQARPPASEPPPQTAAPASAAARPLLGLDNFSVRAMGWKAPRLIEYAASIGADSLFITDLDAFESLDPSDLATIRAQAAAQGLRIVAGTWSICPTSKSFKPNWGNAEQHLARAIDVAKAVGSPVIRVVLGTWEDRLTDGGIARHMEETAKVCRACRTRAQDAQVKIAIENHAGDMHSTELARLIEAAGRDFVGANLDSGNALWTLEDPYDNLETLAPYVLTTSLRDSAVWRSERGARVQWTAMGEGDIDLVSYMTRFRERCPGVAVHIETISGFSRELPYLQPDFWKAWPDMPARSFARFLAIAERGKPREPWSPPAGADQEARRAAEQRYQRGEIERSLAYCRSTLGLGRRSG